MNPGVDTEGTVASPLTPCELPGGAPLPWYWTDDLTTKLIENGRLDEAAVIPSPVAIRRPESSIDDAAVALQDEGEIPLAA